MKYISASFCFIVLLLSVLGTLCICDPVHVQIANEQRKTITLHCRSKNDDLGYHVVEFEKFYNWEFQPNIWGTTLFWCGVLFDSDPQWYYFDAYVHDRDHLLCDLNHCWWQIIEGHQARQFNPRTTEWIYYNLSPDWLLKIRTFCNKCSIFQASSIGPPAMKFICF